MKQKIVITSVMLILLANSAATVSANSSATLMGANEVKRETMLGSPLTTSTTAADHVPDQPVMSAGDQATTGKKLPASFVAARPLVEISRLTLADVQSRAVSDSFNLTLLHLKFFALESKRSDLKMQADRMITRWPMDTYRLPDTPEKIVNHPAYQIPPDATWEQLLWLGPTVETNTVVNGLMSSVTEIVYGMNDMLQAQRNELELTVKQLERDRWNTELDLDEAKEGIKLNITSQYVQLLALREQKKLHEEALQLLHKEYNRLRALQDQGVAAADHMRGLQFKISQQTTEVEVQNMNYRLALLQLCFDLGLRYDPSMVLADVEPVEVRLPPRKQTEEIVTRSHEMKRKWNELKQAWWEQANTKSSNPHGHSYLAANVALTVAQTKQAQVQLIKLIDATYSETDHTYQLYKAAQAEVNEAAANYTVVQRRFQLGSVPSYELNQASFQRQQAEAKLKLLQLQYVMLMSKVGAMEKGYIFASDIAATSKME
ncbi:TolC family protein [Paenibacillus taiwanensis]|uniref:TolC family protein n=1 Tax=Paenibacillus taiwanensis TaxID=401638 RepID=UPI0003FE4A1B|nr:TolC family protein [Paenibacillus taiwanensis]